MGLAKDFEAACHEASTQDDLGTANIFNSTESAMKVLSDVKAIDQDDISLDEDNIYKGLGIKGLFPTL